MISPKTLADNNTHKKERGTAARDLSNDATAIYIQSQQTNKQTNKKSPRTWRTKLLVRDERITSSCKRHWKNC